MGKKPLKRKRPPKSKPKLLLFDEEEAAELEQDAIADKTVDSLSAYIRKLLHTHPDRPKNRKK